MYRETDTKLDSDVAIKVLPASLAGPGVGNTTSPPTGSGLSFYGFMTSSRVAADGAAPFAPQAPYSLRVLLAPSTNGAVRGQDPPGGYETGSSSRGRMHTQKA